MKTLKIHKDISIAQTLQKDLYLSPAYFEATKEKNFASIWFWLCPENGVRTVSICHPLRPTLAKTSPLNITSFSPT